MLNHDDVASLLALQSSAYKLLLWLADAVSWNANFLTAEEAKLLHKPKTADQWLQTHRSQIPETLLPITLNDVFTNIFSSFFSTSFQVSDFDLFETRIKTRAPGPTATRSEVRHCQNLALKHLATAEKLILLDNEADTLVRRKSLHEALLLWTYIWELDRRSKRKGKGQVVHEIWKSIPRETRQSLDADLIWSARQQILQAVRDYQNKQTFES